jgi:hypothetical protein
MPLKLGPWGPVAASWIQGKGIANQEKRASDAAAVNRWQTEQDMYRQRVAHDEQMRQYNADMARQQAMDAQQQSQFEAEQQRLIDKTAADNLVETQQNQMTALRYKQQEMFDWEHYYRSDLMKNSKLLLGDVDQEVDRKMYERFGPEYLDYKHSVDAQGNPMLMRANIAGTETRPDNQLPGYMNTQLVPSQRADTQRMVGQSTVGVNEARIPMIESQTDKNKKWTQLADDYFQIELEKLRLAQDYNPAKIALARESANLLASRAMSERYGIAETEFKMQNTQYKTDVDSIDKMFDDFASLINSAAYDPASSNTANALIAGVSRIRIAYADNMLDDGSDAIEQFKKDVTALEKMNKSGVNKNNVDVQKRIWELTASAKQQLFRLMKIAGDSPDAPRANDVVPGYQDPTYPYVETGEDPFLGPGY